jgi:DNA polymerase I-like protein with 3'-5' exonuclease and polymerase domains
MDKITNQYLHELQAIYHRIDSRGIVVDKKRLDDASEYINNDILSQCNVVSQVWNVPCYIGSANKPLVGASINLNSSSGANTPLEQLKRMGFKIPKVSGRDEDGNYIAKESLAELTLQKIYATNQFNTIGGDPAIRALLRIRELSTLRARYINANLFPCGDYSLFLTNYNCAGTVTGRRGSRKHSFGYGGNAQNFPKHGELAKIFRRCLVARPGKIFLMVDQMQAEDWPTSALANNMEALDDLRSGVDRHRKLGCLIFDIPWDHYTEKEWKDSIERFLGKKTRHANNYGMRGNTMSDSLAKEGHSLTSHQCDEILKKVNQVDPSVDGVFHAYIKECLYKDRTLRTPFGRERIFFGLRAGESGSNNKIFNEAYSYIPQSSVGDNTGFTVYGIERGDSRYAGKVIQESHDSIIQEIDDNVDSIWDHLQNTRKHSTRTIRFHNGIEVEIPWEAEFGYDFYHTETLKSAITKTKKVEDLSYSDLQVAWYKLQEYKEEQRVVDAQGDEVDAATEAKQLGDFVC